MWKRKGDAVTSTDLIRHDLTVNLTEGRRLFLLNLGFWGWLLRNVILMAGLLLMRQAIFEEGRLENLMAFNNISRSSNQPTNKKNPTQSCVSACRGRPFAVNYNDKSTASSYVRIFVEQRVLFDGGTVPEALNQLQIAFARQRASEIYAYIPVYN